MPHVSAARDRAVQSVVVGDMDFAQNTLRRHDLIRAHDEQQTVGSKNAIAGQQIEQRMFGEERASESHQIGYRPVVGVRPPRSELKTVARLLAFGFVSARSLLDMALPRRIAVILGVGSVRYDEQLYILEQPAARPKTLALVTVDLIECLLDIDAAAFQLDMHQRKAVYQHGNIITIRARSVIDFVLINDLERIVMDIAFIEQVDILDRSVVARQQLHMIFLNDGSLFDDSAVFVGDTTRKEPRPLSVGKVIAIEFLQLAAQVGDQFHLVMDRQIFVSLSLQQSDKRPFEFGFRLILFFRAVFGPIVADDRAFGIFSYKVVFYHLLCA